MGNRVNGRGGFAAISAGSPTAVPAPKAWAAQTTYKLDDVVRVTTGNDKSDARCVLPHEAAANGLTAGSDGVIAGPDATNWKAIQAGTLVALRNWSFEVREETTAETYVIESADRTVATTTNATGQLVVADDDADGADVAQRALAVGNEFTLKLYPKGVGTGLPQWTGTARITQESGAFATSTLERTFAFAVQGAWTRARQA